MLATVGLLGEVGRDVRLLQERRSDRMRFALRRQRFRAGGGVPLEQGAGCGLPVADRGDDHRQLAARSGTAVIGDSPDATTPASIERNSAIRAETLLDAVEFGGNRAAMLTPECERTTQK